MRCIKFLFIYLMIVCSVHFTVQAQKVEEKEEEIKREKLTQYLKHLVTLKTLSDDVEENLLALKWVQSQLNSFPLHFTFHTFNGHPSLVITTQQTKTPKVWLVAHMDVVAGSEQLFHPLIKDHKMYGRGAYDMKMAIACYLLLINELGEQLNNYDFGVMLTSDEEIGGMNGVKRLLQEGYASKTALLPDGGFDWNFERMAKGVLQLAIQSHGRSAHASRPWLGRNAINQLIEVLREINLDFEKEKTLRPGYYSTVNVGLIQGGEATNQVPRYAEAKLDIRFPPSSTQEQLYKKVEDIVKRHPEVSTEVLITASPYEANIDLPPFQIFRKYAHELYGIEIGSTQSHGASDARFFGEKHIPVLVIAPTGGDIHSEGEWIDLNDLVRFYEVMKAWVKQISRR